MELSQEQIEDANKISNMIRQFKILYDFWQDEGFYQFERMTQFVMEHLARDILRSVRRHIKKFNIHEGITVNVMESFWRRNKE